MDVMLEPTAEDGGEFGPLLSQVSLFLQAAMETTASLLSWTLVLLSTNPKFWDELRSEALANPTPPSFRDWSSLKWHRAVLNESLRLRPPAWMLPRIASESISIGDVALERGARVIVSPWLTHRIQRLYRNPLSFEPERWLEEGATRIPRGGFFPFGLGQRMCIGERYALLTATIFLHELASLDVLPTLTPSSLDVGSYALIANPSAGIKISLKPS
jgi:cytochrome P450